MAAKEVVEFQPGDIVSVIDVHGDLSTVYVGEWVIIDRDTRQKDLAYNVHKLGDKDRRQGFWAWGLVLVSPIGPPDPKQLELF